MGITNMFIFQLKRKHVLLAVCVCICVPVEQQGLVDFSNMLLRGKNKTWRVNAAPTGFMGTWHTRINSEVTPRWQDSTGVCLAPALTTITGLMPSRAVNFQAVTCFQRAVIQKLQQQEDKSQNLTACWNISTWNSSPALAATTTMTIAGRDPPSAGILSKPQGGFHLRWVHLAKRFWATQRLSLK